MALPGVVAAPVPEADVERDVEADGQGRRSAQRDLQRGATRAQLLEAACRVFARDGLTTARTADIAREAGVSHGTVFVHFPTRDDLLSAVVGTFGERVARRIHDRTAEGGSVRDVLTAHIAGLVEEEAFYARLVSEQPLLPPIARGTLVGIQSAIAWHLGPAVERETGAGTLRPVELPLLFNTWLGLVHHYVVNRDLFAPGTSALERHGPRLVEHMVALLRP
jgi:AcrR family transcriptional regulator